MEKQEQKLLDHGTLVDIILDNRDVSDKVLIKKLERAISKAYPYDHEAESVFDAVKIEDNSTKDFSKLQKDYDKVSQEVEAMETFFSKRELAFIATQSKNRLAKFKEVFVMINKLGQMLD